MEETRLLRTPSLLLNFWADCSLIWLVVFWRAAVPFFLYCRSFTYEIIVVNDGSKDRTSEVVMEYVDRLGANKLRLLQLQENRGKGGAIALAVARSRGQYILMADSDGATDIRDLQKLYEQLKIVEKDGDRKSVV